MESYGAQLGNFYTGAAARGIWRIGSNYPNSFNAFYTDVVGDSALLGSQQNSPGFGWSFTLGRALNGVAYFYVTDADADCDIDRESFLGETLISLSVYFKDVELSLTRQIKFSLAEPFNKTPTYGTISILWKF